MRELKLIFKNTSINAIYFFLFFLNVISNYTTFRQGVISDMPEAVRVNTIERRKTNKKIYL